jgi:hypothetical protein
VGTSGWLYTTHTHFSAECEAAVAVRHKLLNRQVLAHAGGALLSYFNHLILLINLAGNGQQLAAAFVAGQVPSTGLARQLLIFR